MGSVGGAYQLQDGGGVHLERWERSAQWIVGTLGRGDGVTEAGGRGLLGSRPGGVGGAPKRSWASLQPCMARLCEGC